MAKIKIFYSSAIALILPQLKDIVHFVFYGYTKPAKKPDYQLPSSQMSRFLAGIVYKEAQILTSRCMSIVCLFCLCVFLFCLYVCLYVCLFFSVLLYFLSMFVVSVCVSFFVPVCLFCLSVCLMPKNEKEFFVLLL